MKTSLLGMAMTLVAMGSIGCGSGGGSGSTTSGGGSSSGGGSGSGGGSTGGNPYGQYNSLTGTLTTASGVNATFSGSFQGTAQPNPLGSGALVGWTTIPTFHGPAGKLTATVTSPAGASGQLSITQEAAEPTTAATYTCATSSPGAQVELLFALTDASGTKTNYSAGPGGGTCTLTLQDGTDVTDTGEGTNSGVYGTFFAHGLFTASVQGATAAGTDTGTLTASW